MGRKVSAKSAPLARIALKTARKKSEDTQKPTPDDKVADIIEFIESDWGLQMKLFPVQRVILKAHYGIPLDDTKEFMVTDWTRERERWFTEKTYLEWLYEEGRSNIKEVIPGNELRTLILSVGRRSGKCVTGCTLVLTDRGLLRIEDLGDPEGPEIQPLEVEVAQEGSKRSKSTHFYNGGTRETKKITTRCGYTIEGTPNHRIRVMREDGTIQWRYLEDVCDGDQIAIHRGTNLWSTSYVPCDSLTSDRGRKVLDFPAVFTEDWGLLLGYLVGDGSWTIDNRVEVTVEHPETWETLAALMEKTLGEAPKIRMDRRTKNTGNLQVSSVAWRDFLHNLGWRKDCGRYDKFVPWVILRSPETVVRAFLRGLFETDGCVESGGKTVSFSSASERLAREVQILLANLGIVSSKKARWNTHYERNYYILSIRGLRSRKVFAEKIGFDSSKKMTPLLESLVASREGGDTESIPHQRRWCRSLLESVKIATPGQGWSRSKLRSILGNTIKPSAPDSLTYPRLYEILHVAREVAADNSLIQHFEEIVDADYFYDPVTSIEERQAQVYDLVVPDGVSFVANAMTNHNTLISSCIVAYEIYRLIHKYNPQKYYGLVATNRINLVSIATSKDQASLLFNEASGHFSRCNFFKRYKANDTQSYIRFQSPNEIDKYGLFSENPKAPANLRVSFAPCNAKGLRGHGNLVVILDEVAHFVEQGGKSAEKVFEAIYPSMAAFSPKNEKGEGIHGQKTPSDARMIMISSPLNRAGLFYSMFRKGMGDEGPASAANILCIQSPTWEVNPTVPAGTFLEFYTKDPNQFFVEFGAEFTDRLLGFFEDKGDIIACVDRSLRPKKIGVPHVQYFMGFDLGLVTDSSAMAIVHIDGEQIVLDYIGEIRAGMGKYRDKKRLEFDDVADWIYEYSRLFAIHSGMFDQWAAIPLEQALAKKGLRQIQSEHMTDHRNSEIYQNFKSMIFDRRVRLFDLNDMDREMYRREKQPVPEHAPYIQQILELQAEYKSKYIMKVAAPRVAGKHDDLADALARAVWLASMQMGKVVYIAGRPQQQASSGPAPVSYQDIMKQHMQRRLGGSHPQRMKNQGRNQRMYNLYVQRTSTK